jgi:hypothetical protein
VNVKLRRQVNGGAWTVVRQVDYAYYDGVEDHGNAGDLKTATVKDGSGNVLETKYYRYYTLGEEAGYEHGMKYVVYGESYARLAAAVSDPFTATDAQIAPYADFYFEYDDNRRVSKEVVQAAGCSSCSGGLGEYTFTYGLRQWPPGVVPTQDYYVKTIETLPDGNQNIVFLNFYGETVLHVYRDAVTEQEWSTFYKYDLQGRLVLTAYPSAISDYDEDYSDLLRLVDGNYQYLRDNEGLIQTISYYSATTATATTPGGAEGYIEQVALQRGELGTDVPQSTMEYWVHEDVNGNTIYPVAHDDRVSQRRRHRGRDDQPQLYLVHRQQQDAIANDHVPGRVHGAKRPRQRRSADDLLRQLRPANLVQGRRRLSDLHGL